MKLQSELWTGMTSGNISSAAEAFRTELINLGLDTLEAKEELFEFLLSDENDEYNLTKSSSKVLSTPIDHPSCKPGGHLWAKSLVRLDQLEGLRLQKPRRCKLNANS